MFLGKRVWLTGFVWRRGFLLESVCLVFGGGGRVETLVGCVGLVWLGKCEVDEDPYDVADE